MPILREIWNKIKESFKPSHRGRLDYEKTLSLKSFRLLVLSFVFAGFSVIILGIVLVFISSIKDVNQQLSTVVAIILGTQLLFVVIQILTQHVNNRYTRIEYMPNINVEIIEGELLDSYSKELWEEPYLIVRNTGRDAHNVSVGIRSNKKIVYSKKPLFPLKKDSFVGIVKIGDEKAFKRSRIDVYVHFEDIVGILHNGHFIKYPKQDRFVTKYTGL